MLLKIEIVVTAACQVWFSFGLGSAGSPAIKAVIVCSECLLCTLIITWGTEKWIAV
jgi:hypothetical protein